MQLLTHCTSVFGLVIAYLDMQLFTHCTSMLRIEKLHYYAQLYLQIWSQLVLVLSPFSLTFKHRHTILLNGYSITMPYFFDTTD